MTYFCPANGDEHERYLELEFLRFRASLVQLRIAKGFTVEDLGRRVDMRIGDVLAVEDFTKDPHMSTIRRYAKEVGVLFRWDAAMPTPKPDPEADEGDTTQEREQ